MMQAFAEQSLPSDLMVIREMTTAMLVAAAAQRWSEVQRIDVARMKILGTISAEHFASDDDAVRQILHEALSATKTIEQQAKAERDAHASDLKQMNLRKSSAKAYGKYAQAV